MRSWYWSFGFVALVHSCTSDGSILWALTSGEGARPAELLTVDPATGVETVIGPTGTAAGRPPG